MNSLKKAINEKYGTSKVQLEGAYRKNYDEDMIFRDLANKLNLPPEELMKYTSQLEVSSKELEHCKKCKNLLECQNEVNGYVFYPLNNDNQIEFCYLPCKYKKKVDKDLAYKKNTLYFNISNDLKEASMKNIDTVDKKRYPAIKWINDYLNDKLPYHKGLYLDGNFGCGKTYLLSAMFNELAKRDKQVAIIYYPEFLRSLKGSFNTDNEFNDKFNYIKKVEYLLLDDIGAESVTDWSRDEILGTILQYRMEEKLPTFFTSNLTIDELETHLSVSSNKIDKVKAKRIIERVKQLSNEITMISENKRK